MKRFLTLCGLLALLPMSACVVAPAPGYYADPAPQYYYPAYEAYPVYYGGYYHHGYGYGRGYGYRHHHH